MSNPWLQWLAAQFDPHVHDQGLAVFVLREETVRRGLTKRLVALIRKACFAAATRLLADDEIEHVAARTRGGDWEASALSQLDFRVERLEFTAGVADFHLPVDAALGGVGVG